MVNIKTKINKSKEFINLTPLIDIVFLLLIFFMLTSNFIETEGIKIKLPEASSKTVVQNENITIYVTKDSKVFFNGKFLSLKELPVVLKRAIENSDTKIVILKADKQSKMEIVVKVLDFAKSFGAKKLVIATKKIIASQIDF
jgi:biopolymer transport protein ExbD